MYAFMAMASSGSMQGGEATFEMTDKEGNPTRYPRLTSHLVGLFNRTINLLENKIKPIWVFDGKPPELKMEELKKRAAAKAEAKEQAIEMKEIGDIEQMQ